MPEAVLLVYTYCTDPAREDEFNRWYDDVHIPDVLKAPHIVGATRYRLSGPPPRNGGEPHATYLAIYQLDTDDTRGVMKGLNEHSKHLIEAGRMIDCLGLVSTTTYIQSGARAGVTVKGRS